MVVRVAVMEMHDSPVMIEDTTTSSVIVETVAFEVTVVTSVVVTARPDAVDVTVSVVVDVDAVPALSITNPVPAANVTRATRATLPASTAPRTCMEVEAGSAYLYGDPSRPRFRTQERLR